MAGLVFLGPRLLKPKVPAEQAAERVLVGLRDGDYAAAHRALATGQAGGLFADAAALQVAAEACARACWRSCWFLMALSPPQRQPYPRRKRVSSSRSRRSAPPLALT